MFVPFGTSFGYGTGAAAESPVAISGIREGDVLLAVSSWDPAGGVPVGRAVTAFAVSDGAIESATVSTAGHRVVAWWYRVAS